MELVTLPQSRELEKSILGAILMDKRTLPLVVGHLKTEVFYDLGHQKIFDVVKKMYDDGVYVDITTLNQKLTLKMLVFCINEKDDKSPILST